jgi:flagellar L-ring protein precursor FlgH
MEPIKAPEVKAQAEMPKASNGTILRDVRDFSLFEDSRPVRTGDMVIVQINERTNASKKAKTAADRKDEMGMNVPKVGGGVPFGQDLSNMNISASGSNKFSGGGETSANDLFTGTITTMVTDVMPNGHLVIDGTKQINISNEVQTLKFSGIVNPKFIGSGGQVSSLNVAEVRVKYIGAGQINESQFMGWLSRIFLNVMPF